MEGPVSPPSLLRTPVPRLDLLPDGKVTPQDRSFFSASPADRPPTSHKDASCVETPRPADPSGPPRPPFGSYPFPLFQSVEPIVPPSPRHQSKGFSRQQKSPRLNAAQEGARSSPRRPRGDLLFSPRHLANLSHQGSASPATPFSGRKTPHHGLKTPHKPRAVLRGAAAGASDTDSDGDVASSSSSSSKDEHSGCQSGSSNGSGQRGPDPVVAGTLFRTSSSGGISKLRLSSLPASVPTAPLSSQHVHPPLEAGFSPPLKRKRPPRLDIPSGAAFGDKPSACHVVNLAEDALDEMNVEIEPYYGVSCKRGRRDTLEDTYRAISDLQGDPSKAFFGVFDGHGGRRAADYAAQHLADNIMRAVVGGAAGQQSSLGQQQPSAEVSMETALKQGYLATDQGFLQQELPSGASCVTTLMRDGQVWVANAGDCRAVMSRAGKAVALTSDHRAGREDERGRIERLGGHVDFCQGVWRVQGVLAVSRGIGDRHLKQWITAEPEVSNLPITPDCEFLVMASDGLWDVISNQEAVDLVRPLLNLKSPLSSPSSAFGATSPQRFRGGEKDVLTPLKHLEARGHVREGSDSGSGVTFMEDADADCLSGNTVTLVEGGDGDEEVNFCSGSMEGLPDETGGLDSPLPDRGPNAACRRLVEMSLQRGSHDDVSVMVVQLQRFAKGPQSISNRASAGVHVGDEVGAAQGSKGAVASPSLPGVSGLGVLRRAGSCGGQDIPSAGTALVLAAVGR